MSCDVRHVAMAKRNYLEILWAAINRPFPKNIKPPRKNLPPIFADKGLILFETITLSKIN